MLKKSSNEKFSHLQDRQKHFKVGSIYLAYSYTQVIIGKQTISLAVVQKTMHSG